MFFLLLPMDLRELIQNSAQSMPQEENMGMLMLIPMLLLGAIVTFFLFWMLAILGYGSIFSAGKMRKKFLTKRFGKDIQMNLKPGAFSFFSNPTAKTMDIILLLAILLLIVVSLTPLKEAYLMVILFSLFTWAVNMHCLFNSRTFRITKYKIKRGRMA